MTDHVARLYALVVAALVFVVAWAGVAAHPWAEPTPDPRAAALAARERKLEREGARVAALLETRYADYRLALAARQRVNAAIAAAPAPPAPRVQVVSLPPVAATRSS